MKPRIQPHCSPAVDAVLPANSLSRRQLLRRASHAAGAAMLTPSLVSLLTATAAGHAKGRNKKLLVLWLEGGPSQFETFDPKPGTATGGPTKSLATDVDGWTISEFLPGLRRRADQLCVIRSMTSKEGNHSRAREFVKTGYVANPSVSFPSIGSIVASQLGKEDAELPPYIQINGAPSGAGYLGLGYGPFVIQDPSGKIRNLGYHKGVDDRRLDHRQDMLAILERGFAGHGGEEAVQANRSLRKRARSLMDSRQLSAFDLDQEKEKTRDRYGQNKFGQGCLLARRLLEADVPAVEVVLGGWDTHDDNFNQTQKNCESLDPAFSALLDDLRRSGLEKETLVLCLGEFGRTPRISATEGRGHWPRNWCAALAGRGIRTGMALGETDPSGEQILQRPVTVPDLYATVAHLLGFDPDLEFTVSQRPITLVDPEGKIVREILA